ncbi:MAG: hypothetical protein H6Q16_37 [Bacteroidetes bacterium]|nr:hypothetical protein [Bacteroidota bacterium]
MNYIEKIELIIKESLESIETNQYKGYDPADLLNSKYNFIKKLPGGILKVISLINIYSPYNFRPILKVQPAENTTAMVILGHIYLNLYKVYKDEVYLTKINFIESWLLNNAIKDNNTLGWARIIDYQFNSKQDFKNNSSLTFINAEALKLFLDLYEYTKYSKYLDYSIKIADHLSLETNIIKREFGYCLSYASKLNIEIYNASIIAGSQLNRLYKYTNNEDYLELSLRILEYTLQIQKKDGSWYYSLNNGKEKKQIDFHQTYMLSGIIDYEFEIENKEVINNYNNGLDFYVKKMFDDRGLPYWRYPIKYPIDVHNISHAILFFSKYNIEPDLNRKLINLLIDEFYNKRMKQFYYHKWPFLKNKIHYFRWNTIWSIYALSVYVLKNKM